MSKPTLEKVALEQLIDQYLIRDVPLSLLLESYDVTFPQMQLLMNRIRGFSRQVDMLNEENDNFSYNDLPEDYLVIPHTFTEKYPLKHQTTMEFFEQLAIIKEELASIDSIDLNEYEQRIKDAQAKVNSYDPIVIGKIESFIHDYDEFASAGKPIDEVVMINLLSKNNITIKESHQLNSLYDSYLKAKEEVIECENDLELKKIAKNKRPKLEREYEDIREILVVHNVKLVNWCIRKFFNNIAIQKEEAQAYGLEGLVRAINNFDYTKGFHFSTYAVIIIVRHIEAHFEELYGMKWNDFIRKNSIKYYRRLMMEENPSRKTTPTAQELADMGLVSLSASKIEELDKLAYPAQPFSSVHNEMDDGYPKNCRTELPTSMADYETIDDYQDETEVVDEDFDVEEIVFDKKMREDIKEILDELTEKEAEIIKLRYGFTDGKVHTLEEIGAMFDLSRERVRQIENKAIRKMRHPSRVRKIRGYYDDSVGFRRPYRQTIKEAEKNSRDYAKLMELLGQNISKQGILAFMNMNGANWDETQLEIAIANLDKLKDYFMYYIDESIENPYDIKSILEKEYDISLTPDFIKELLNKYKDSPIQGPSSQEEGPKKM